MVVTGNTGQPALAQASVEKYQWGVSAGPEKVIVGVTCSRYDDQAIDPLLDEHPSGAAFGFHILVGFRYQQVVPKFGGRTGHGLGELGKKGIGNIGDDQADRSRPAGSHSTG
jgi:hypothetical protein